MLRIFQWKLSPCNQIQDYAQLANDCVDSYSYLRKCVSQKNWIRIFIGYYYYMISRLITRRLRAYVQLGVCSASSSIFDLHFNAILVIYDCQSMLKIHYINTIGTIEQVIVPVDMSFQRLLCQLKSLNRKRLPKKINIIINQVSTTDILWWLSLG